MTYNPIIRTTNQYPPQEPGTVIVVTSDAKTYLPENKDRSIVRMIQDYSSPKLLGIAAGIVILLWFVIGAFGVLFLCILLGACSAFMFLNRDHPVTTALLGAGPKYHLVDVSTHTIKDERSIQLADAGVHATIEIEYQVSAKDAVSVVDAGVKDVREYLSQKIYSRVKNVASTGTLEDKLTSFRNELNNVAGALCSKEFDELFLIYGSTIDARVGGKTGEQLSVLATSSLERQSVEEDARRNATERRYFENLISSPDALFAEMMRPGADKGAIENAMRSQMEQENLTYARKLELLKMALENGVIEERQLNMDYPDFIKDISNTLRDVTIGKENEAKKIEERKGNEPDQEK